MRAALLGLALAGCALDPGQDAALPSDAYFTGLPPQFATIEDCLAQEPGPYGWGCAFELALCHSGAAGRRTGDAIETGRYHLEGERAVGTLGAAAFEFDVATGTDLSTPAGGPMTWHPDTEGRWMTLEADVIDCTQPPI